jgi:hypothetical protein
MAKLICARYNRKDLEAAFRQGISAEAESREIIGEATLSDHDLHEVAGLFYLWLKEQQEVS